MNSYARSCRHYQDGYCMKDATAPYRTGHRVDDSDASTFFCRSCRGGRQAVPSPLNSGLGFLGSREKREATKAEQVTL